MVAAADQLAASAGLGMLDRGGSAADAAVATGAAMAVVGPHLCGLGGDVLAMVSPPDGPPEALLSIGRGRRRLRRGRPAPRGPRDNAGARRHPQRAGARRRRRLAGPARALRPAAAGRGAGAGHRAGRGRLPRLHHAGAGQPSRPRRRTVPASCAPTARSTSARRCGSRASPARCAPSPATGAQGFYEGEFGRGLLDLGDGHFAPADFATSVASWCAPLHATAWGHELWTVPPPSQGYLTLAGAAVAEAAGLGADPTIRSGPTSSSRPGAPSATTARPCSTTVPTARRCSDPDRLAAAAARVSAHAMAPPDVAPGRGTTGPDVARLGDGDTTHLCAQDADGLGISLTQSNALDFGSHLVGADHRRLPAQPRRGLLARPGSPGRGGARAAPARTPSPPCSSPRAAPAAAALTHLVGAMGGDAQPQIIVQLLARLLRSGQDPARAITAPRFTLDAPSAGPFRLWWGEDLTVLVEADAPPAWPAGLTGHGHRVQTISAFDPVAVGCAQIIATESARARHRRPACRRHTVAASGRGVGPAQPGRRRAGPLRGAQGGG